MSTVEYNLETSLDQGEDCGHGEGECDHNLHLWHSKHEPWATLPSGWSYPIQSDTFRHWVTGEFVRANGGQQSRGQGQLTKTKIDALISDYTARALFGDDGLGAEEYEVHLRFAPDGDDGAYLDMADPAGRAIHITQTGWEIVAKPPVKFYRPPNMLPLPEPDRAGAAAILLYDLLNLHDPAEFRLLATTLSYYLLPHKSYPINLFIGGEGTAKSWATRFVRNVIEPSRVPLIGMPRGTDLVAFAKNHAMLCFDNVSKLPEWLQDELCRAATGGGFGGRKYYTNDGDASFHASRPIIMNGITDFATRPDLANRCISYRLATITERKTEAELRQTFDEAHPKILAALLDATVTGLRRLHEVAAEGRYLCRLADFTLWGYAVAPALGWSEEEFLSAYKATQKATTEAVLDADPVASELIAFLHGPQQGCEWSGLVKTLWHTLSGHAAEARRSHEWPQSPEAMGRALKRITTAMGDRGIRIAEHRKSAGKWVTITP